MSAEETLSKDLSNTDYPTISGNIMVSNDVGTNLTDSNALDISTLNDDAQSKIDILDESKTEKNINYDNINNDSDAKSDVDGIKSTSDEKNNDAKEEKIEESFIAQKVFSTEEQIELDNLRVKIKEMIKVIDIMSLDKLDEEQQLELESNKSDLRTLQENYEKIFGSSYKISQKEIVELFVAKFLHMFQNKRELNFIKELYTEDAILNVEGLKVTQGQINVTKALINSLLGLELKYKLESIVVEDNPPERCDVFFKFYYSITVDNDRPKRVMEVIEAIYVSKNDKFELCIKNQIFIPLGSRPLYIYSDFVEEKDEEKVEEKNNEGNEQAEGEEDEEGEEDDGEYEDEQ